MFKGRLRGVSRDIEGSLKGTLRVSKKVQWVFQGIFKAVSSFKEVSRVFRESIKLVSRKISNKVLRVFQERFNKALFCNFVVA